MIFKSTDGSAHFGITQNVSLHGLLLVPVIKEHRLSAGQHGVIQLTVQYVRHTFPCRVVHVQPNGIGCAIDEADGRFSTTLISALQQEGQVQTGVNLDSEETIQVRISTHSNTATIPIPTGRLITLNSSSMEFELPLSPENQSHLSAGSALWIEIQPVHSPPIPVEGVVRQLICTPAAQSAASQARCSFVFATLPTPSVQAIRKLVQRLHTRRLQRMIACRATTLALHSGDDLPRWLQRHHIRNHLQRFFGQPL